MSRRTGRPIGRPRGHAPHVLAKRGLGNGSKECVLLHRLRAAQALGKPLPLKAEVHHADGSKRDDAPLVICQDRAYHMLLHVRMKTIKAGGNPNTEKVCGMCHVPRPHTEFHAAKRGGYQLQGKCKSCMHNWRKARRAQHQ